MTKLLSYRYDKGMSTTEAQKILPLPHYKDHVSSHVLSSHVLRCDAQSTEIESTSWACTRKKGHKGMHEVEGVASHRLRARWKAMSNKEKIDEAKKRMYLTEEDAILLKKARVHA